MLWRQLRFHITENLIGRRAEHITFFRFVFRELLADGGDGFLLWGSSAIPRSVKNIGKGEVILLRFALSFCETARFLRTLSSSAT